MEKTETPLKKMQYHLINYSRLTRMVRGQIGYIDKKDRFLFLTGTSLVLIEHNTQKACPSLTIIYDDNSK